MAVNYLAVWMLTVRRNPDACYLDEIRAAEDSITEDRKIEFYARCYLLLYLFRRSLYVAAGLFVKSPGIQILTLFYLNLVGLIYSGSKPWFDRNLNNLEMRCELL